MNVSKQTIISAKFSKLPLSFAPKQMSIYVHKLQTKFNIFMYHQTSAIMK